MAVLTAYGPLRLISSPSARCRDTLAPYARAAGLALELRQPYAEESFAKDPDRALTSLRKVVARAKPVAICTHRPLLPALLSELLAMAADADVAALLADSVKHGMDKGEAIVAHVAGRGEHAVIVAAERHTQA